MSAEDKAKWDAKYASRPMKTCGPPAEWVERNLGSLPRGGRVLDLACGDGANTLLLASRGNRVVAVDISEQGLAIGKKIAGPLPIDWVEADLDDYSPPANEFDLVVCIKFLDRKRIVEIVNDALKPGGLLLAETYNTRDGLSHVKNPDFLLRDGEWLMLFPSYQVLAHDESGPTSKLLARKPIA